MKRGNDSSVPWAVLVAGLLGGCGLFDSSEDGVGGAPGYVCEDESAAPEVPYVNRLGLSVDVDVDGYADLVSGLIPRDSGPPGLRIFRGGPGGLDPERTLPGGPNWNEPTGRFTMVGDLDGDGYSDWVRWVRREAGLEPGATLLRGGPGRVTVETVPLEPSAARPYTHEAQGSYAVPVGDMDGDGRVDLVVWHSAYVLDLYYGRSDGVLSPDPDASWEVASVAEWAWTPEHYEYAGIRRGIVPLGDLDGDGTDDLYVRVYFGSSYGEPYVLFGSTDRRLRWVRTMELTGWSEPVDMPGVLSGPLDLAGRGDVDGDGHEDTVLFTNAAAAYISGPDGASYPELVVLYGSTGGLRRVGLLMTSRDAAQWPFEAGVDDAVVVDVSGDGVDDVVVTVHSDERPLLFAAVFLGRRGEPLPGSPDYWMELNDSLVAGAGYPVLPDGRLKLAVYSPGDVDGDGFADAAFTAWSQGLCIGRDCPSPLGRAAYFVFPGGPCGLRANEGRAIASSPGDPYILYSTPIWVGVRR